MLVRFISFVITVFGTKRYKPLLFTCAALIISFTGISAVAAFSPSQITPAASTATAEEQQDSRKDTITQQTPRKQAPRDDTTVQPSPQTTTPTSPTTPGNPTGPSSTTQQQDATAADITLSTSTVALGKNSTSETVKATLNDSTTTEWSATFTENVPGIQVNLDASQHSSTASFTLKTSSSTPAGRYTLTVQAKDSVRNTIRTKILTVVITE